VERALSSGQHVTAHVALPLLGFDGDVELQSSALVTGSAAQQLVWQLTHDEGLALAAALMPGALPEAADVVVRLLAAPLPPSLALGPVSRPPLAVHAASAADVELARGLLSLRDVANEAHGCLLCFELPLTGRRDARVDLVLSVELICRPAAALL